MKFSFSRVKTPTLINSLLAVLSAVLLILAFPDFDLWFLAWFALVPLFYAIEREKESIIKTFILGWIFGTVFFSGSCWWLTFSFTTYGGIAKPIAYFLLFIICSIIGIFPAVFAASFSIVLRRFGICGILSAPFLWTAQEFLRASLADTSWNAIGYSQAFANHLIQTAQIGGVYLVGFIISLSNLVFFSILLLLYKFSTLKKSRKQSIAYILALFFGRDYFSTGVGLQSEFLEKPQALSYFDRKKMRKYAWLYKPGDKVRLLIVGLVFFPVIFLGLSVLLPDILGVTNFRSRESTELLSETQVVVVQANVPMSGLNEEKWLRLRRRHAELAEEAIQKLDAPRTDKRLSLTVIFPESPMNFAYSDDPEFRQFIGDFARRHNASVLFNSAEPNSNGDNYFNSAIMINPRGEKIGQYDKIHLVPFGEFAPVPSPIKPLIPTLVGSFQPGENYSLFPVGDVSAGIMICYESHFPSLSREFAKRGADVLIEMTNDGYLGNTAVLRQHLAGAIFRAVETNRPVIRATNVGITAYINERGEVSDAADVYTEATRVWTISKSGGEQTFYVRHGDWFAWLCSIVSLSLLFFCFWKKRNSTTDLHA